MRPHSAADRILEVMDPQRKKSSPEQIRERFDRDVARFSDLEKGQAAAMDAPVALGLIAAVAAAVAPAAGHVLDVGCGAGNFTLSLLARLSGPADVTLVDLSRPMLDRAVERVGAVTSGRVTALLGDIRSVALREETFDVVLAGAVLHHLREQKEWADVFAKLHAALRPGGALWVFDMVEHESPPVRALMWERWACYLGELGGEAYRDHVLTYVAEEDSPRPLLFQLDLMRRVGFVDVEVLHKNACFAAFGGRRSAESSGRDGRGNASAALEVGRT